MTVQNKGAKFALNNIDIPEAALGAFALLLGAYVAIDASGYHDGSTYDGLGPSLMPYIIAGGLILTGLPILVGALLSRERVGPVEQIDWMPIALIRCERLTRNKSFPRRERDYVGSAKPVLWCPDVEPWRPSESNQG